MRRHRAQDRQADGWGLSRSIAANCSHFGSSLSQIHRPSPVVFLRMAHSLGAKRGRSSSPLLRQEGLSNDDSGSHLPGIKPKRKTRPKPELRAPGRQGVHQGERKERRRSCSSQSGAQGRTGHQGNVKWRCLGWQHQCHGGASGGSLWGPQGERKRGRKEGRR